MLENNYDDFYEVEKQLEIKKKANSDKVVALAGNPNVGKSTIFNALTGMKQHTGNWPGKTVANAQGYCSTDENAYVFVDIPGTYSLMSHSTEEEIARNFICFENPDAVIIVCDATCLERNLNLVLQTLEMTSKVVVCVNILDEAERKGIDIDIKKLSKELGVKVVGTNAKNKKTLKNLLKALDEEVSEDNFSFEKIVDYPDVIEIAINIIEPLLLGKIPDNMNKRWVSLKLLEGDNSLINEINKRCKTDILRDEEISNALDEATKVLDINRISPDKVKDFTVASITKKAEETANKCVTFKNENYNHLDRKIDKVLTSKWVGYPLMIALLLMIFWVTITGANYPSQMLSNFFGFVEVKLTCLFTFLNAPNWLYEILVLGVYKVVTWVIAVMLPPMAIFFPLFTILEDAGYLPRVAYNLDKPFKRCNACGKQCLSMCMGFGCNAAGVIGCRIIDSKRERLLAILTNNFVPCNGRFPTLIALITMFFVGFSGSIGASFLSALLLTAVILLGVFATFLSTKLLAKTMLKGEASSYTLELPPYRKPQIFKSIIRSFFDRTLFVLGRAIVVSIPAGLIIWIMANISINDITLLSYCSNFLDPFAQLIGLDGVILMGFILGIPANEIVIPIIIMAYMSQGNLLELDSLAQMKQLFLDNGWTYITAICMICFSLLHWPCSTTLMTIKKETNSVKWTVVSALLPTIMGIIVCFLISTISKIFI